MNILWLSWKDSKHPLAGGAEVVMHELSKRMVADGHQVTVLTARYSGSEHQDVIDGIKIIRVGNNRYVHSFAALKYYRQNLRNKYDLVIEAVNTAPYFSPFSKDSATRVLFYHQLAREVWFHEAPAPISQLGYFVLEPAGTRMLARPNIKTLTISESTRKDLQRFGFKPERVHVISQGMQLEPVKDIKKIAKFTIPTVLSLGGMRKMKRTLDQIKAFERAKEYIPELQLKIAGDNSSEYGKKVLAYIAKSPHKDDIEVMGRVSDAVKMDTMKRSHAILVTSIKEGWGLIVTEAASQGTPAVVYDVDGLRDSVVNGQTGIITKTNPQAMAKGIQKILSDPKAYEKMRKAGWEWSKRINFEQSYKDMKKVLEI